MTIGSGIDGLPGRTSGGHSTPVITLAVILFVGLASGAAAAWWAAIDAGGASRPSDVSTVPDVAGGEMTMRTLDLNIGVRGLLFGLGPTADAALQSPLAREAPVRLLTTWFNGTDDLAWLRTWQDTLIPQAYADGYAHHVIVYDGGATTTTQTSYGPACGQPYPLSDQLLTDLREVEQIFRGDGPLYVTMFTEFQTYPCVHNQWQGSEAYYQALKDQFLAALAIFHEANPRARVGLGWGGWQGRWDDPAVGGGRSLIEHFADVLEASDYQAFQAMEVDRNVADIRTMTGLLAPFGPVMLAHYLPDDESPDVWDADVAEIFTDAFMTEITDAGLFAFNFMDPLLLNSAPVRLQSAVDAVRRYAADWLVPPSLLARTPSLAAACPTGLPTAGFADVGASVHREAIECMRGWGITAGTGDGRFEPDAALTRAQLATLLHRVSMRTALSTEDVPRSEFVDVPTDHAHQEAIETLAGLGVILGVGEGRFAPSQSVTRGQFASLVIRLHEEVTGAGVEESGRSFTDIGGTTHEQRIRQLVALGVTTGYADGSFRPGQDITRAQMASMIMRWVDHLARHEFIEVPAA